MADFQIQVEAKKMDHPRRQPIEDRPDEPITPESVVELNGKQYLVKDLLRHVAKMLEAVGENPSDAAQRR